MLILPGTFCNGSKFSVVAAQFGVVCTNQFEELKIWETFNFSIEIKKQMSTVQRNAKQQDHCFPDSGSIWFFYGKTFH
jgi:hypothetical protein